MSFLVNYVTRSVVYSLVSKLAEEYFDGINREQLQVSLAAGEVYLKDISVKPSFLSSLNSPLTILSVKIKNVRVRVPMTSFLSGAWEVNLCGISVHLKPREARRSYPETAEAAAERRRKSLSTLQKAFEAKKRVFSALHGSLGLSATFLRNVKLCLSDVNLYLHHHLGERAPSLKVCLGCVDFHSAKGDDWEVTTEPQTAKSYKKRLHIRGFKIIPFEATKQREDAFKERQRTNAFKPNGLNFFSVLGGLGGTSWGMYTAPEVQQIEDDSPKNRKKKAIEDATTPDHRSLFHLAELEVKAELQSDPFLAVKINAFVGNIRGTLPMIYLIPPKCTKEKGRVLPCGMCDACRTDVCLSTAIRRSLIKMNQRAPRPFLFFERDELQCNEHKQLAVARMWQYAVRCVINNRRQTTRRTSDYQSYKTVAAKKALLIEYKELKILSVTNKISDVQKRLLDQYEYHLPKALLISVWTEVLDDTSVGGWFGWNTKNHKIEDLSSEISVKFERTRETNTDTPHIVFDITEVPTATSEVFLTANFKEMSGGYYSCTNLGSEKEVLGNEVSFVEAETRRVVTLVAKSKLLATEVSGDVAVCTTTEASLDPHGNLIIDAFGRSVALPHHDRPFLLSTLLTLCEANDITHFLPKQCLTFSLSFSGASIDFIDKEKQNSPLKQIVYIPGDSSITVRHIQEERVKTAADGIPDSPSSSASEEVEAGFGASVATPMPYAKRFSGGTGVTPGIGIGSTFFSQSHPKNEHIVREMVQKLQVVTNAPVSLEVDFAFMHFTSTLILPEIPNIYETEEQRGERLAQNTPKLSNWCTEPIAGPANDYPFANLVLPNIAVSNVPDSHSKTEGTFKPEGTRNGHPMWKLACSSQGEDQFCRERSNCQLCRQTVIFCTVGGRWMVGPAEMVPRNAGWLLTNHTHGGVLPCDIDSRWLLSGDDNWQECNILVTPQFDQNGPAEETEDLVTMLPHRYSPQSSLSNVSSATGSDDGTPDGTPDDTPLQATQKRTSLPPLMPPPPSATAWQRHSLGDLRMARSAGSASQRERLTSLHSSDFSEPEMMSSLASSFNNVSTTHSGVLTDPASDTTAPEGAPLSVPPPLRARERIQFYARPPLLTPEARILGGDVGDVIAMEMDAETKALRVSVNGRSLVSPAVIRVHLGGSPRLDLLAYVRSKIKLNSQCLEVVKNGRIALPYVNLPKILGEVKYIAECCGVEHSVPSKLQAVSEHVLTRPEGLSCSSSGTLYIADAFNHRVLRWVPGCCSGQVVAGGNGGGASKHQLRCPADVCVVSHRGVTQIFVADTQNHRIQRVVADSTEDSDTVTVAGKKGKGSGVSHLCFPSSVEIGGDGKLYICDTGNNRVVTWRMGEDHLQRVVAGSVHGTRGSDGTLLDTPKGIFVTKDCNVYIADTLNHRIVRCDYGAKQFVVVAGSGNAGPLAHELCKPHGVVVRPDGSLIIADTGNDRIQIWRAGSPAGITVRYNMRAPRGLCLSPHGIVYVADTLNNMVLQCVPPYSTVTLRGEHDEWGELTPHHREAFTYEGIQYSCLQDCHNLCKGRDGWFTKHMSTDKLMDIMLAAFVQRKRPREVLETTGTSPIRLVTDDDTLWGVGVGGKGPNTYGTTLASVREYLRRPALDLSFHVTRGVAFRFPLSRPSEPHKEWVAVVRANEVLLPGVSLEGVKQGWFRFPTSSATNNFYLHLKNASLWMEARGADGKVLNAKDIQRLWRTHGRANAQDVGSHTLVAEAVGQEALAHECPLISRSDIALHVQSTRDHSSAASYWGCTGSKITPTKNAHAVSLNLSPIGLQLLTHFLKEVGNFAGNFNRAPSPAAYRSRIGAWMIGGPSLVVQGMGKQWERPPRFRYIAHSVVIEKEKVSLNDRWVLRMFRERGESTVWPCGTTIAADRERYGENCIDPSGILLLSENIQLPEDPVPMLLPDLSKLPLLSEALYALQKICEPCGTHSGLCEPSPAVLWEKVCRAHVSLADTELPHSLPRSAVTTLRKVLSPGKPPAPHEAYRILLQVNTALAPLFRTSYAITWKVKAGIRGSEPLQVNDRVQVRDNTNEPWQYGVVSAVVDGAVEVVLHPTGDTPLVEGVAGAVYAHVARHEETTMCTMRHARRAEAEELLAVMKAKMQENADRVRQYGSSSGHHPYVTPARQIWPEKHCRLDKEGFPNATFFKSHMYVSIPRVEVKLCDMSCSTLFLLQMEGLWYEVSDSFYDKVLDAGIRELSVWERRTRVNWKDTRARKRIVEVSALTEPLDPVATNDETMQSLYTEPDSDTNSIPFVDTEGTAAVSDADSTEDFPKGMMYGQTDDETWRLKRLWQSLGDEMAQRGLDKYLLFSEPVTQTANVFHRILRCSTTTGVPARRGASSMAPTCGWGDAPFHPKAASDPQPWFHPQEDVQGPLGLYFNMIQSKSQRSLWGTAEGMNGVTASMQLGDVRIDVNRAMIPDTVWKYNVWMDPLTGFPEALCSFKWPGYEPIPCNVPPLSSKLRMQATFESLTTTIGVGGIAGYHPAFKLAVSSPGGSAIYHTSSHNFKKHLEIKLGRTEVVSLYSDLCSTLLWVKAVKPSTWAVDVKLQEHNDGRKHQAVHGEVGNVSVTYSSGAVSQLVAMYPANAVRVVHSSYIRQRYAAPLVDGSLRDEADTNRYTTLGVVRYPCCAVDTLNTWRGMVLRGDLLHTATPAYDITISTSRVSVCAPYRIKPTQDNFSDASSLRIGVPSLQVVLEGCALKCNESGGILEGVDGENARLSITFAKDEELKAIGPVVLDEMSFRCELDRADERTELSVVVSEVRTLRVAPIFVERAMSALEVALDVPDGMIPFQEILPEDYLEGYTHATSPGQRVSSLSVSVSSIPARGVYVSCPLSDVENDKVATPKKKATIPAEKVLKLRCSSLTLRGVAPLEDGKHGNLLSLQIENVDVTYAKSDPGYGDVLTPRFNDTSPPRVYFEMRQVSVLLTSDVVRTSTPVFSYNWAEPEPTTTRTQTTQEEVNHRPAKTATTDVSLSSLHLDLEEGDPLLAAALLRFEDVGHSEVDDGRRYLLDVDVLPLSVCISASLIERCVLVWKARRAAPPSPLPPPDNSTALRSISGVVTVSSPLLSPSASFPTPIGRDVIAREGSPLVRVSEEEFEWNVTETEVLLATKGFGDRWVVAPHGVWSLEETKEVTVYIKPTRYLILTTSTCSNGTQEQWMQPIVLQSLVRIVFCDTLFAVTGFDRDLRHCTMSGGVATRELAAEIARDLVMLPFGSSVVFGDNCTVMSAKPPANSVETTLKPIRLPSCEVHAEDAESTSSSSNAMRQYIQGGMLVGIKLAKATLNIEEGWDAEKYFSFTAASNLELTLPREGDAEMDASVSDMGIWSVRRAPQNATTNSSQSNAHSSTGSNPKRRPSLQSPPVLFAPTPMLPGETQEKTAAVLRVYPLAFSVKRQVVDQGFAATVSLLGRTSKMCGDFSSGPRGRAPSRASQPDFDAASDFSPHAGLTQCPGCWATLRVSSEDILDAKGIATAFAELTASPEQLSPKSARIRRAKESAQKGQDKHRRRSRMQQPSPGDEEPSYLTAALIHQHENQHRIYVEKETVELKNCRIEVLGELGTMELTLISDRDGFDVEMLKSQCNLSQLSGAITLPMSQCCALETTSMHADLTYTFHSRVEVHNITCGHWDVMLDMGQKFTLNREKTSLGQHTQSLRVCPWVREDVDQENAVLATSVTISADTLINITTTLRHMGATKRSKRKRRGDTTGSLYTVLNETGLPLVLGVREDAEQVDPVQLHGAYQSRVRMNESVVLALGGERGRIPMTAAIDETDREVVGAAEVRSAVYKRSAQGFVVATRSSREVFRVRKLRVQRLFEMVCTPGCPLPLCVARTSAREGALQTTVRSTVVVRNEFDFPIALRLHHPMQANVSSKVSREVDVFPIIVIPPASPLQDNIAAIPLLFVTKGVSFDVRPLQAALNDPEESQTVASRLHELRTEGGLSTIEDGEREELGCMLWSSPLTTRDGMRGVPVYVLHKPFAAKGDMGARNKKIMLKSQVAKFPIPTNADVARLHRHNLSNGLFMSAVYTPTWRAQELSAGGSEDELATRDLEIVLRPTVTITNNLPYPLQYYVDDHHEGALYETQHHPLLQKALTELQKMVFAEEWSDASRDALTLLLKSKELGAAVTQTLSESGWDSAKKHFEGPPSKAVVDILCERLAYACHPRVILPGKSASLLSVSLENDTTVCFTVHAPVHLYSSGLAIPRVSAVESFDYMVLLSPDKKSVNSSTQRLFVTHETRTNANVVLTVWTPLWFVSQVSPKTCRSLTIMKEGGRFILRGDEIITRAMHGLRQGQVCQYSPPTIIGKQKNVKFRVAVDDSEMSSVFQCNEIGTHNVLCTSREGDKEVHVVPINVTTQAAPGDFARSRMVTFRDRYMAYNHLSETVQLRVAQFGDNSVYTLVPPQTSVPITWGWKGESGALSKMRKLDGALPNLQIALQGSDHWSPEFPCNMMSGRAKVCL